MKKEKDNMTSVRNLVYLQAYKRVSCPSCNRLIVEVSEDATGVLLLYCRHCKKKFTVSL